MDKNKRRSSLRKPSNVDDGEATRTIGTKRRISFSEKKFVRVFCNEEEAKNWNNSYEISDHTNGEDSNHSQQSNASHHVTVQKSLVAQFDKEKTENENLSSNSILKISPNTDLTLLPEEIYWLQMPPRSTHIDKENTFSSFSLSTVGQQKLINISNLNPMEKTIDLFKEFPSRCRKYNESIHPNVDDIEIDNMQQTLQPIGSRTILQDVSMNLTLEPETNDSRPHPSSFMDAVNTVPAQDANMSVNMEITCHEIDIETEKEKDKDKEAHKQDTSDFSFSSPGIINKLPIWNGREKEVDRTGSRVDPVTSLDSTSNFLGDNSSCSSPLIPLDVIADNCIKKKLNFLQLNDEIESGRIKLFPNGPKTPTTDRKMKGKRFWNVETPQLEQLESTPVPFSRSRGALNFDEDLIMSSAQRHLSKEAPKLLEGTSNNKKVEWNYRISQADEMMLNNTDFLLNARDEYESIRKDHVEDGLSRSNRESSNLIKSRQTMIFTDAMIEEEEKIEEKYSCPERKETNLFKSRQTIHCTEAMIEESIRIDVAEDPFLSPTKGISNLPKSKSRQTIIFADAMIEESMRKDEIEEELPSPVKESSNSLKSRQTRHIAESIVEELDGKNHEEDPFSGFNKRTSNLSKSRRTRHVAEPMVEESIRINDVEDPFLSPNKETSNLPKSRQTIIFADAMIEESMRKDEIEEELPSPVKESSNSLKSRQTRHVAESIIEELDGKNHEEDPFSGFNKRTSNLSKSRRTRHVAEPMVEESIRIDDVADPFLSPNKETSNLPKSKSRQTIIFADAMINESMRNEDMEKELPSAGREDGNLFKSRPTRHDAEPMIEESIRNESIENAFPGNNREIKSLSKLKQTLHDAEALMESESVVQPNPRQTMHFTETIMDESVCILKDSIRIPNSKRNQVNRNTLIMSEAIDEEATITNKLKEITMNCRKPRPTSHAAESILEEPSTTSTAVSEKHRPPLQRTMHLNESVNESCLVRAASPPSGSCHVDDNSEEVSGSDNFKSKLEKSRWLLNNNTKSCHLRTPYTPTRSLLEFEECEDKDNDWCLSDQIGQTQTGKPRCTTYKTVNMDIDVEVTPKQKAAKPPTAKRLPFNLTPHCPHPKKRHSLKLVHYSSTEEELTLKESHGSHGPHVMSGGRENKSPFVEIIDLEDQSVQLPRLLVPQPKKSILPLESNKVKQTTTMFEDNPITISDVSEYFQVGDSKMTRLPTPATPKVERCSSGSDQGFKSLTTVNKNLINLNETNFNSPDALDNIQISLVSITPEQIEEQEEEEEEEGGEEIVKTVCEAKDCSKSNNQGVNKIRRTCKKCQCTLNETQDSFVLPPPPRADSSDDFGLAELLEIRKHPTIADVENYWAKRRLERLSNIKIDATTSAIDEIKFGEDSNVNLVEKYQKSVDRFVAKLRSSKSHHCVKPFYKRLSALLPTEKQGGNWMFDYQMRDAKILIFTYRKIRTFRLVAKFEFLDDLETNVKISSMKADYNHIPSRYWKVYDHLPNFQLQLKMPCNLSETLPTGDEKVIFRILQQIDSVCAEVQLSCKALEQVVVDTESLLLREANRTVVKKIVKEVVEFEGYVDIKKTQFVVEISNLSNLSFRDILQPRLYLFSEDIQNLPIGIDFLRTFLTNPQQYLKPPPQPQP